MNPYVQWFCRLGIDRQIVKPGTCEALRQAFGDDVELLTFAQTLLDDGVVENFDVLQALVDDVVIRAEDGGLPALPELGLPDPSTDSGSAPAADGTAGRSVGSAAAPSRPEESLADLVKAALAARQLPKGRDRVLAAEGGANPDGADSDLSGASAPVVQFSSEMPDLDQIGELAPEQGLDLMNNLLTAVRAMGASDLHLSASSTPFARVYGRIVPLGAQQLSRSAAATLNTALLQEHEVAAFDAEHDFTFALQLADRSRYRVSLALHKDGLAGTYHIVPRKIKTLAELGFPNHERIGKLLDFDNGLILVTGAAGSGKTTTLAALVESLNRSGEDHIITIEDPIEFVYASKGCFITQREVGRHTSTYVSALKGALREDPDIIAIGELHDLATIEMAITAAETGHLVLGTLHTSDAANTLNCLLDVFPPTQQSQIRAMASESLRGILCQQLLPRKDGKGVAVACELYVNTGAGANIIREGATHLLKGVMQTGVSDGMRSMDQSVLDLYEAGVIAEEVALANLRSKELIRRMTTKSGPA